LGSNHGPIFNNQFVCSCVSQTEGINLISGEYFQKSAAIWQQLVEDGDPAGTVEALEPIAYNAWINAVGDIAIEPSLGALTTGN
jgi:hypothetical protein